jgi:desulfoferrodoxin (superoxide reductase-like protein)
VSGSQAPDPHSPCARQARHTPKVASQIGSVAAVQDAVVHTHWISVSSQRGVVAVHCMQLAPQCSATVHAAHAVPVS